MGYNLTNERIQDTYQQLLQISGSTIIDGTGSVAPVLITSASYSDFSVSSSYAEYAGNIDTSSLTTLSTFNAYTSSNDASITSLSSSTSASIADINNQIALLEAGSGSADWDLITNKPSGIVSSSAQTLKNVSGSSITPVVVNATSVIATQHLGTNGIFSGNLSALGSIDATSMTASNALINNNLIVNGTASFGYLQSITGSAKIIGDAYIILNNDTPTQRYAGIVVQDSGSTNNTASFEFDGQTNDWFYEYTDDGGVTAEYGAVMFGPGYNTKGSHVYPSNNTILKGTGDHHIVDSIMSDDGTEVNIDGRLLFPNNAVPIGNQNFQPTTGSVQIGYNALTAQGQNQVVIGYGGDGYGESNIVIGYSSDAGESGSPINNAIAIGHSARVTANNAIAIGADADVSASSNYSVAIGNQSNVQGQYSLHISLDDANTNTTGDQTINIGKDINNQNGYSIAIGQNITNNGTGGNVLLGRSITANADYSIAIGESVTAASQGGIAIGNSANSQGNSVAIGNGAYMGSSYGFAGGYNARANNDASIAIGGDVQASSNQAIAIGTDTVIDASSQGAVALGQDADITTSPKAVTLGQGVKATGASGGVAIGSGSFIGNTGEINIGNRFTYNSGSSGEILLKSNVETTGQIYSPTFAGSVASSTSSIDFDNGNFATLSLSAATFLANPSNLKSGTTYTIIMTSGSHIANHGSAWKFAEGTAPTYTDGTDVLTCVSDGTNLYATALTNFS